MLCCVVCVCVCRDTEYLWIAEEALHQTELPSGWSEYLDADGRPYYNHPSQPHSTYEHPVDTYHKALYEFHRAQEYGTYEITSRPRLNPKGGAPGALQ